MADNTSDIKRIDIKEFRERGYLHEVNRLVLHPLGLALEVNVNDETGAESLGGVWDYREDPEGILYDNDLLSVEKATAVADEIEARGPARIAALGYVIQPVTPEAKQLSLTVKEHTEFRIGPNGEIDAGEERPGVVVDGEVLP